jgi:hypothetical protein
MQEVSNRGLVISLILRKLVINKNNCLRLPMDLPNGWEKCLKSSSLRIICSMTKILKKIRGLSLLELVINM